MPPNYTHIRFFIHKESDKPCHLPQGEKDSCSKEVTFTLTLNLLSLTVQGTKIQNFGIPFLIECAASLLCFHCNWCFLKRGTTPKTLKNQGQLSKLQWSYRSDHMEMVLIDAKQKYFYLSLKWSCSRKGCSLLRLFSSSRSATKPQYLSFLYHVLFSNSFCIQKELLNRQILQ